MTVRITHIGGPTALLEVEGWRLLTDPTFDPPGPPPNASWERRELAWPEAKRAYHRGGLW